jgi:hypothetical protein
MIGSRPQLLTSTGHPNPSLDKDKDIEKLSKMVSQLTHLLAAAGAVRSSRLLSKTCLTAPRAKKLPREHSLT